MSASGTNTPEYILSDMLNKYNSISNNYASGSISSWSAKSQIMNVTGNIQGFEAICFRASVDKITVSGCNKDAIYNAVQGYGFYWHYKYYNVYYDAGLDTLTITIISADFI